MNCAQQAVFDPHEATIADMQAAMAAGVTTARALLASHLDRRRAFDQAGPSLNSVPVLSPEAFAEAERADRLRSAGRLLGPLHGIPFTLKENIAVAGLPITAGSPAFANLVAREDAFLVSRLRAAGAVLVGLTTMPPMAAGGLHRGLRGRAESPYSGDYLTAAWGSGSSNGAGSSTASSLAAFALGTETTSSGRSPASNNALVAYTPSRGLISARGVMPLYPIRDVVVPLTRCVDDLMAVLDVLVADDPLTTGDLWREQRAVALPPVATVRPGSFAELAQADSLRGKRIGVPTMFIGKDHTGRAAFGVRPSIVRLWQGAAEALRALGATIVEVDFATMHDYEQDRPGARGPVERGLLPARWWRPVDFATGRVGTSLEYMQLNPFAWEQFLRHNGQPGLDSWRDVDPAAVFPHPPGSVDARRLGSCRPYAAARTAIMEGYCPPGELPGLADALIGAERFRQLAFEDWLRSAGLDALAFPANADVARADSDVDERSYDHAMSNGTLFSATNLMMRHLGIPSVTVCMGIMPDTGMPVGVTFAGPAYADSDLIAFAYAYEHATHHRRPPSSVPPLPSLTRDGQAARGNQVVLRAHNCR